MAEPRLFHLHVALPFTIHDDYGEWDAMLDEALRLYEAHKDKGARLYTEWLAERRGKPLPGFTMAGTNCRVIVKEIF